MWSRVNGMSVSEFKKNDDGAMLVFFALCCAAIFLVAALTFDIGRRASTQTELQSFTDHVALAAAGELNGFPEAIDRAINAAEDLIRDEFVIGEGDRELGPGDFHIYFYETLPDSDEDPLVNELDQSLDANDALARFVRVAMINDRGEDKRVQVPWVFARLLSIFGQDNLPSDLIGAESVAGYTSLACDVAPVFFCMPDDNSPAAGDLWNPKDHIGEVIRLRSGGGNTGGNGNGNGGGNNSGGDSGSGGGYWEPGNFTWLDIREQVPDTLVDLDGPCQGLSGNNLYECLFAAEGGTTLCFPNGLLTTLPGQKEGNVAAVFDTRFDIYSSSSSNVTDDERFRPAPVVNKAYEADGVCGANQEATTTTMALPPDDCFASSTCDTWTGQQRYGDGDWSAGRLKYVETNYSRDLNSINDWGNESNVADPSNDILAGGEILEIDGEFYHRDDPFRPDPTLADYDILAFTSAANVSGYTDIDDLSRTSLINENLPNGMSSVDYSATFPVVPNGAPRWEYYQAEVASTLYSNPKLVYNPDSTLLFDGDDSNDGDYLNTYDDTFGSDRGSPLDLIRDIRNGGNTYDRLGSSNPYCSVQGPGDSNNFSPNPRRRTLVAAAVDCSAQKINGKTDDVRATWFVEVFLVSPSDDDPADKKKKEIFVEIISPALNSGEYITTPGRFRNLVQLYR